MTRGFDSIVVGEMVSHGLRDQDRLEGASNYVIWKTKILAMLEEYDLEAYIKSFVVVLAYNDKKKSTRPIRGRRRGSYSMELEITWCLTLAGKRYSLRDEGRFVFTI